MVVVILIKRGVVDRENLEKIKVGDIKNCGVITKMSSRY